MGPGATPNAPKGSGPRRLVFARGRKEASSARSHREAPSVQSSEETLGVVIPVYQGAETLRPVVEELLDWSSGLNDDGVLTLAEIVLVHDGAVDDSATVMLELEAEHEAVRAIWLSRNFGQHAATLAGCASTTTDWIVTMDEDGLHDPTSIPSLVAHAREGQHDLVYAISRSVPHRRWRSITSNWSKWVAERLLGVEGASRFSSFRLMDGQIARSLAAYSGHGVYLDVAARWVFASAGAVETRFREELRGGASGYSLHSLLTHFRRLTVTAGARPLRYAAALGLLAMVGGLVYAAFVVTMRLTGEIDVPGWTSVMAVMTILLGLVLFILGLIAEYLSAALGMVSGRPPYLIVGQPPRITR